MGIQGLLPQLKSIMVPIHIKDLEGCNVAVDTYSWLHKGALSCSRELCKGLPTSRHIEYCMHRVNLLRHFGVKPILVFDGGLLPMKCEQENKRSRVRKENFARAVEHESNGNSAAAYECYQKAVDISPLVACELIQVLKQENVQYIVAPYEADAQMTFLAVRNQVEAVITEDSDLIPFGCPRIIFKMDKFGQGVEYRFSMLQKNKELSFEGFTRQMLLEMCILSGCDYLQSLPGMGLKRAHAIIKRFRSYDKVLKHLRYSGVSVPPFYEESFKKAVLTFQFQRVYDPINEDIVHLSDVPDDIDDDLDFLGPSMPKHIAQGIAKGNLDPFTKMPFQGENLSAELAIERSSQLKTFNSESGKKKIDLPVQKNLLTKYFCFASLEAKRKFKAPRTSPTATNQRTQDSYPVSLQEYGTSDASACKANNSEASLADSEILCNDSSANNSTHDSFATKISGFARSPSHGKDINCGFDEKLSSIIPLRVGLTSMCLNEVETVSMKSRSPEHTILRQPSQPIHKPCLGSHKVREHKNEHTIPRQPNQPIHTIVQDMLETQKQNKEMTRKVIVRSPYFQPKPVEKNDWDQKQDCLVKADVVIENNIKSESALCKDYVKKEVLKRKSSSNDFVQSENLRPSNILPASPPLDNGNCDHNGDRASAENIPEEEKFGAKISHLGHYSEIAEKSMERFVSVMSSFRFSSSGSRASGLRAPLRDVRIACNNRSTNLDFGQYAYLPNNQKTRKIDHRG